MLKGRFTFRFIILQLLVSKSKPPTFYRRPFIIEEKVFFTNFLHKEKKIKVLFPCFIYHQYYDPFDSRLHQLMPLTIC